MRILLWETTEFSLYLIKNKKWIHKRTFPGALTNVILKTCFHRIITLLIWNLSDPFRNAFHSNAPLGCSAATLFLCSTLYQFHTKLVTVAHTVLCLYAKIIFQLRCVTIFLKNYCQSVTTDGGHHEALLKPATVANLSICSTFTCFHPYMSMFGILTSQSGKTTMFLAICYVALFQWTPEGVCDSGILSELVGPHSNCVCKWICCKVIVKSLAQNVRKHESAKQTHTNQHLCLSLIYFICI